MESEKRAEKRREVGGILKEFLEKTRVAEMAKGEQNEQTEKKRILEGMKNEIDSALEREIHCRWDELLAAEELARLAERVYFGSSEENGRELANKLLPFFLDLGVDVNFARVVDI